MVDMQFSKSATALINFEAYLKALHRVGDLAEIYVLPRYAMMRYWSEQKVFNFDEVAPEDRAKLAARVYDCIAYKLAQVIQRRRPMSRIGFWRDFLLAVAFLFPATALAATSHWCGAPPGWTSIMQPLEHTAARINAGGALNIIAIGSSSTVGVGATTPEQTYPSQLQAALSAHFPDA